METPPPTTDSSAQKRSPDAEIRDDPRALTILSTEHWGLLSARGLAYNEAFTRANMYLTFVSMSLVALALLANVTNIDRRFLGVAATVLGADFVAGLLTTLRMVLARLEDTRATLAMNRIRNAYLSISPTVGRYLVTSSHDDLRGLRLSETLGMRTSIGAVENLASSGLMVGVINVLIGGAFVFTVLLIAGLDVGAARTIGALSAIALAALAFGVVIPRVARQLSNFETRFPTPPHEQS
jgi:hypothetical protein